MPYGEWAANWWQWLLSTPLAENPGEVDNCQAGQGGEVFYIAHVLPGVTRETRRSVPFRWGSEGPLVASVVPCGPWARCRLPRPLGSRAVLGVPSIGRDGRVAGGYEVARSHRDRSATADRSWITWMLIGIAAIWIGVLGISIAAPDLVSGSRARAPAAGRLHDLDLGPRRHGRPALGHVQAARRRGETAALDRPRHRDRRHLGCGPGPERRPAGLGDRVRSPPSCRSGHW